MGWKLMTRPKVIQGAIAIGVYLLILGLVVPAYAINPIAILLIAFFYMFVRGYVDV